MLHRLQASGCLGPSSATAMPSGLDAALKSMGVDKDVPWPTKVQQGFSVEKKKKAEMTECTIDPEELGEEKCGKIVKEQEFKIRKLKEKMAGIPPTKKNKPEIAKVKDDIEILQADGNYRGALAFVRKLEEEERDRRREERDKEEEAEAAGNKKDAAPKKAAKKEEESAAASSGTFECDAEVVGVVKSSIEGSSDAAAQLSKGPGAGPYKSVVKAEVATIVFEAPELISAKLKRVASREAALKTVRALLWCPPAVLPAFPTVLLLLEEAKLKGEPTGSALDLCTELAKAGPRSRAVPQLVLPALIAHTGAAAAGKWKVKVSVMGILRKVLHEMAQPTGCPRQLGMLMPSVMSAMRDAVGDARKEVKKEAEVFLRYMGDELIVTPEIKKQASGMVESILDSANMDKAGEVLHRLANTTFLHTVDSCSFALLFPVVARAMREQAHDSKMKGVQIIGASVNLIADPVLLQPYFEELLPLLKECLLHPTVSVQYEAAKSFGSLAAGLPHLYDEHIMPWLLETLQSQETNDDVSEVERRGAARGLAMALLARKDLLPTCLHGNIIPRICSGKTKEVKAGGLQLIEALASAGPAAFLPHLKRCIQPVLNAMKEESEVVHKQAVEAFRVFIGQYGTTAPQLLMPRLQEALFFEDIEPRDRAMGTFAALCEKLAEGMKFGQDFLSMDCLPVWQRHILLVSMFIARTDECFDVKRLAQLLWKEKLQSGPKAKSEILPRLLQVLKALKASGNAARVKAAELCAAELGEEASTSALASVEALPGAGGVLFAKEASDVETTEGAAQEEVTAAPELLRPLILQQRAKDGLKSAIIAEPLRQYIEAVFVSSCMESKTKAEAEEALQADLKPLADKKALEAASGDALVAFGLREVFEKILEGVADQAEENRHMRDADCLIHVEGLRMMYGGGHMLLKDAVLDLRRGHRYGVVGRNGAGKTTLMSTIATGGISGMSSSVKTLHVKPEVLIEVSDLNAVQFCSKELEEQDVDESSLQKALQEVGFPTEMQQKAVSELSGGWRMKLLLATAMLRECDILLLDEPTNHLDKESVKWLTTYLRSLTRSSLMVISHDPGFLNAVCTDIIQYSSQRTLDYYPGNFDDFRAARHISSDEEAEALLLGRSTFDDEEGDNVADDSEAGKASGGVTAGALDKTSKISFPIPGNLKGQSASKPVMELKDVFFAYDEDGPLILKNISCKVSLTSRVGIIGQNGAGKSTLLNLLCGELHPTPSPEGKLGEVFQHRNLRLAYIAQQHMYHLGDFMNSSPYVYIQRRYQNGCDEALQRRLLDPVNEEESKMRSELAKKHGKYGFEVGAITSRVVRSNEVLYEVAWKGCDDPKQNTFENMAKLKKLGVAGFAKAYDERTAGQAAGLDTRPLSQKEIVKHLEQFGLDEDMIMSREIGGFSAGQKSKLTLGASFWTKPHVVALDEPTNYIDMETLDALVQGLGRFKGGIIVISHASEFVNQVCSETWKVEGGIIAEKTNKKK